LEIIPFEGATEGRQLYREAKLEQALGEMQGKNYVKALEFINQAKLWPVTSGGKTLDKDIDVRLENWRLHLLSKMGLTKEKQTRRLKHSGFIN
jgi:hypothetical protein